MRNIFSGALGACPPHLHLGKPDPVMVSPVQLSLVAAGGRRQVPGPCDRLAKQEAAEQAGLGQGVISRVTAIQSENQSVNMFTFSAGVYSFLSLFAQ